MGEFSISSSLLLIFRLEQTSLNKSVIGVIWRARKIAAVLESVITLVSCAISSQFSTKSHSLKLTISKGGLIQVFIIFFHSLYKPATLVQIHTQHMGEGGVVMKIDGLGPSNISC